MKRGIFPDFSLYQQNSLSRARRYVRELDVADTVWKLKRTLLLAKQRLFPAFVISLGLMISSKFLVGCQTTTSVALTPTVYLQQLKGTIGEDLSHPVKTTPILLARPMGPSQPGQWLERSRSAILSNYLEGRESRDPTPPPFMAFSVPDRFQGKVIRKVTLPDHEKAIALTFDDGPWPEMTPKVLDILNQHQVKATFFWVGQHLRNFPEVAKPVAIAGHAIGNHTWHHRYINVDRTTAANEIENTGVWINKISGSRTALFRPPGGKLSNGLSAYAQEQKFAVIMWSIDPGDSKPNVTADKLVKAVLDNAHSGGIVLLHDSGNRVATVQALPKIIRGLKDKGYRFLTVPELLELADRHATGGLDR